MYSVLSFVKNTSENEEPGVDFDRQASAHEPTEFGPSERSRQVGNRNKVVLILFAEDGQYRENVVADNRDMVRIRES